MMANTVLREIANGTWFLTNLMFIIFICYYIILMLCRHSSLSSISIRFAIAASIYALAATLRPSYIWALLFAENADIDWITDALKPMGWIMIFSAYCGLAGMLWVMRILSDSDWSPKIWTAVGAFCVVAPVILHVSFNQGTQDWIYAVISWWWYTGNWDPSGIP
jgi:hypothetical protein